MSLLRASATPLYTVHAVKLQKNSLRTFKVAYNDGVRKLLKRP